MDLLVAKDFDAPLKINLKNVWTFAENIEKSWNFFFQFRKVEILIVIHLEITRYVVLCSFVSSFHMVAIAEAAFSD